MIDNGARDADAVKRRSPLRFSRISLLSRKITTIAFNAPWLARVQLRIFATPFEERARPTADNGLSADKIM